MPGEWVSGGECLMGGIEDEVFSKLGWTSA